MYIYFQVCTVLLVLTCLRTRCSGSLGGTVRDTTSTSLARETTLSYRRDYCSRPRSGCSIIEEWT